MLLLNQHHQCRRRRLPLPCVARTATVLTAFFFQPTGAFPSVWSSPRQAQPKTATGCVETSPCVDILFLPTDWRFAVRLELSTPSSAISQPNTVTASTTGAAAFSSLCCTYGHPVWTAFFLQPTSALPSVWSSPRPAHPSQSNTVTGSLSA